jgi:hypothetical protein
MAVETPDLPDGFEQLLTSEEAQDCWDDFYNDPKKAEGLHWIPLIERNTFPKFPDKSSLAFAALGFQHCIDAF